MPRTKMDTIPDPGLSRSTLLRIGEGTVLLKGPNSCLRYKCGQCGEVLINGVPGKYVVDLVLACNACGAFNQSPGVDTSRRRMTDVTNVLAVPVGLHYLPEPLIARDRGLFASERALQEHPTEQLNKSGS